MAPGAAGLTRAGYGARVRMVWLLAALIACSATPERRGVIVVSLDTLRADRVGAYGSNAGLTPNLDRMAAQAVIFDQAFAPANETLYSHAALFTGRYASRLAPLGSDWRLPDDSTTVAERVRDAGWDTAAFVAGGHMSKAFGLDPGFVTYEGEAQWASLADTGPAALRWLDGRTDPARPFLLLVHGYDPHDRYLKPAPFGYGLADRDYVGAGRDVGRRPGGVSDVLAGRATMRADLVGMLPFLHPRFDRGAGIERLDPHAVALTGADTAHLTALYDGAVAWGDAALGLFLAGLVQRELYDDVTLIMLSDHGEELGEAGVFHHRYGLDDAVAHVPLVVRFPNGEGGGRRLSGLVGLIDVAPTLLDFGGIGALPDAEGRSLRGMIERGEAGRDVVVSEGALRLLSARTAEARLTVEGLSLDNAYTPALLRALPIDGVTLRLDGAAAAEAPLRAALASFVAGGAP